MSFFRYLPTRLLPLLQNQSPELLSSLTELRLRKGLPFSVTVRGRNLLLDPSGLPCGADRAIRGTAHDIDECLEKMTGGSLYAFEEQLAGGFLTLPDGCRAGVAGEMTLSADGRPVFREITSINLRVSRFLPRFALPLAETFARDGLCGVLVCSPPAGGKTTFLRSAAHLLCTGSPPRRVGIADERGELLLPQGIFDRVSGCPKGKAIELLTRTMSPEVIVCDELGAGDEHAVLAAQNTGVALVASVHARSVGEALRRPCVRTLTDAGVFGLAAVLGEGFSVRLQPIPGGPA